MSLVLVEETKEAVGIQGVKMEIEVNVMTKIIVLVGVADVESYHNVYTYLKYVQAYYTCKKSEAL